MPSADRLQIGILAIQGSFAEHAAALKKIGVGVRAVKTKDDLAKVAGLIIPGGESTVIGKLLKKYGLDEEIKKRATLRGRENGAAPLRSAVVWGTCAGAILLAKKIGGGRPEGGLGLMDIEVERNAYGRQQESFETTLKIPALGTRPVPAVFIRAPIIKTASKGAKIMAYCNGAPVMVQQENLLATTFHPELTDDLRVHRYFISMVNEYAGKKN